MRRRKLKTLTAGATMICGLALTTAQAQLFHRGEPAPAEPPTLEQIARTLDKIEDSVRDDGIVVIKQPDVWGEARMTKYRREFEQMFLTQMLTDTAKFDQGLQAIIARTDQASFENRTALAGVLTKTAPDSSRPGRRQEINIEASAVPTALNPMTTNVFNATGLPGFQTAAGTPATQTTPFDPAGGLLTATSTAFGFPKAAAVEPTVKLDELKRYIEAGHRHRQNQQGDDISDSAGYGLYLIRMPVSIQPGETTLKGHGAMVTATMYHDFTQDYLGTTFRNLVINDLVDQLAPAVYQILREDIPGRRIELEGKIASTQAELDRIQEEKKQLIIAVTERILADLQVSILDKKESIEKLVNAVQLQPSPQLSPTFSPAELLYRGQLQDLISQAEITSNKVIDAARANNAAIGNVNRTPADLNAGGPQVNPPAVAMRPFQAVRPDDIQVAKADAALEKLTQAWRLAKGFSTKDLFPDEFIATIRGWGDPSSKVEPAAMVVQFKKVLEKYPVPAADLDRVANAAANQLVQLRQQVAVQEGRRADLSNLLISKRRVLSNILATAFPSTRFGPRIYPIAPTDLDAVFIEENLFALAEQTKLALTTRTPRATDIRAFLKNQLQTAYDIFETFDERTVSEDGDLVVRAGFRPDEAPITPGSRNFVEAVAEDIRGRNFEDSIIETKLRAKYRYLLRNLPGDLEVKEIDFATFKPRLLHALCWAVTVEAGLLNEQLRKDMHNVAGVGGFTPDGSESMSFHYEMPRQGGNDPGHPYWAAQEMFTRYVKARWPIITFSLDPVTDQQNIADAYSRERDLQLAIAFAFSAGRINFQQMNRYIQKLRYEAATIDLNRTVTSFAYGTDTFGWRFSPRYQTPPEERNNARRLTNLVTKGGPGRDYQMRNSKLEAGQRELAVVVIMPSILQRIRMDVSSNWYPLHDPDEMEISTARMIKQGREVVELRECLGSPDLCRHYRPGDVQRMVTRVKQLESMLPMQTLPVQVPYENTLGGFQLFSQGSTALVPELLGYEGLDVIDPAKGGTIFIHGKNISIHETNVVAGGLVVTDSLGIIGQAKATEVATKNATVTDPPQKAAVVIPTQVDAEILSREVIRVKIPCGVSTTSFIEGDDGAQYLEVYLATPNGISNRLMIPVLGHTLSQKPSSTATPTPAPAPAPTPAPAASGFSLDSKSKTLGINYQWRSSAADSLELVSTAHAPDILKVNWSDPVGVGPQSIDVSIKVELKDGRSMDLKTFSFTSSNGGPFGQNTNDIVKRLFTTISGDKSFKSGDILPPTGVATLTVVPKGVGSNVYQTDPSPRELTEKVAITLNPVSIATAARQAGAPGLGAITPASSPSGRTSSPLTAPVVRNPAPAMSRGEAYATSPTAGHVQAPRDPGVGRVGYPPQSLPQATRPASPYVAPTASRPAAPAPVDRRAVAPARAPIVPSTAPARPAPSPAPARQVPPPASKPQRRSILSRIGGRAD